MKKLIWTAIFSLALSLSMAQGTASLDLKNIDAKSGLYADLAKQIWNLAEVGFKEYKSAALLQENLQKEGFSINKGVADIPTAFVASYGSGKPIIGILGEYDALPGLSQATKSSKESLGGAAGHACGHHLFGVGSAAAAIAVKEYIQKNKISGTIRFYGTPAEEGGSGKVYMVREGLFSDVDVVIHWHPASANSANASSSLANKSGKFRFYGRSAHAAASPQSGRSALDGLEAMTHMINMMREHVQQDSRIHYVITQGGKAPNVVPDFAELYVYARHPNRTQVKEIWDWLENIAKGAALGTGTTVESEILGGVYELLPLESLAKIMHKNLIYVGGYTMNAEERAFAEQISKTTGISPKPLESTQSIVPFSTSTEGVGGSTDVGDVSWAVPTVGLSTATWVPGTPAHSWQAVAAGGMSLGTKGMIMASKTMALTAIDLLTQPALIQKAREEFETKRGGTFKYESLIGSRKPALNYRD
jgi:aminobenzoyl-glutamate utilization protein B